jgi:hypothetical protein
VRVVHPRERKLMPARVETPPLTSSVRRPAAPGASGRRREWYYQLIPDAGHSLPANAARHFVMLRDGAMSAAYLDTPTTATRTVTRGVDGLIRTVDTIP